MSNIILGAGPSGSGSLTLQAPNTNSNQTVNFPDASGIPMVSGNMPAFSAYNTSVQSITNNAWNKILFPTEDFDTNNNFASSTFTPTVAGYYQISTSWNPPASNSGLAGISVWKNGSNYKVGGFLYPNSVQGLSQSMTCLVYCNGSTDYIDIYGYQNSGGSLNTNAGSVNMWFQGVMVRSA